MKKRKLMLFVVFAFLLSACDLGLNFGSFVSNTASSNDSISATTESSITDSESSSISSEVSAITSDTPSVSSETSITENRPTHGTQTLNFYAINDTHGAIHENITFDEPGLARVGAFLKAKKAEDPNAVILSTGDMWQGTFEAYHSKGEVVTEVMNEIGFDALAIGNHEFDWGPDPIRANAALAEFPFLGANIMEYPNTGVKSDIGEEYVILERGHVKIGVIGMIGRNQMTSICSRLIEDIYFAEITPVIKRISTKLRNEENVDVVVLAIHAGQDDVPVSLAEEKYVDLVFNAHTHRYETKVEYGVPFIQGGSKGRFASHVQIEFDYGTNEITVNTHENINLNYNALNSDAAVTNILNTYKTASDTASNEYVGYLTSDMENAYGFPNVLNYATARLAAAQGFDELDFVYSGNSREYLYSGDVTYGDLYKAHPFDNEVYIVKVRGNELLAQKNYNHFYRVRDYNTIDNNSTYYVAIQDFSILHQDINKNYNYFPSLHPATDIVGMITNADGSAMLPRDIVFDEFKEAPNNILDMHHSKYHGDRYVNFTV